MIDHYALHCQMQEDTSRPLLNEIESLRQQLAEKDAEIERITHERNNLKALLHARNTGVAASQLREQQLRAWIEKWCKFDSLNMDLRGWFRFSAEYKALPTDTSALEAMIAKAGEVMRERAAKETERTFDTQGRLVYFKDFADAIRALPDVTLGDVK